MKAADISDEDFLAAVRACARTSSGWASRWDVAQHLFPFPRPKWGEPDPYGKLVLAKARRLLRRNLISGCGCGCRGDWSVLP